MTAISESRADDACYSSHGGGPTKGMHGPEGGGGGSCVADTTRFTEEFIAVDAVAVADRLCFRVRISVNNNHRLQRRGSPILFTIERCGHHEARG